MTTAAAGARTTGIDNGANVVEIRPMQGWRAIDLREIWRSRELVGYIAARDLKIRYKQTALGALWAVAQPLAMVITFTLVFGKIAGVASDGIPYAVFAMAGLVPWTFFAAGVSRSSLALVGATSLMSKVYFPRLVLPLAALGVGLVDLAISTAVLMVLMVAQHQPIGPNVVLLIPLLMLALTASLGFGLLASALTVRYRDLGHALPLLIQLGMYATPVIYPISLLQRLLESRGLPGWLLGINPMSAVVAGFRDVLFGTQDLTAGLLGCSVVVTVVALVAGTVVFRRIEGNVVDVI